MGEDGDARQQEGGSLARIEARVQFGTETIATAVLVDAVKREDVVVEGCWPVCEQRNQEGRRCSQGCRDRSGSDGGWTGHEEHTSYIKGPCYLHQIFRGCYAGEGAPQRL